MLEQADHQGGYLACGHLLSKRGITVDRDQQILVMSQPNGLLRIDPANGARTRFVHNELFKRGLWTLGNCGQPAGTILVADNVNGVVRVNPLTGVPTVLAAGNSSPLWIPFGVTLAPNGDIWVANPGAQIGRTNGLLRIDPVTVVPTPVSGNGY